MYRKRWVCLGLSAFFGVVCIVVGAVGPILLNEMIQKQVNQQMLMTESDADTWGLVPGKTEVHLYRQMYFFNVSNPEEIKWNGAKPALAQTQAYKYLEVVHYLERIYGPLDDVDDAYVRFRRYVWMNKTDDWEGVKDTDLITQVNVGAISAWDQMKHLPPETLALAALYSIVSGLDGILFVSAVAQGIAASFLPLIKTSYVQVFESEGIIEAKATQIWTDPNYGWASQTTFSAWIQAELQCQTPTGFNYTVSHGTGVIYLLKTYFGLTDAEMEGILGGWLSDVYQATSIIVSSAYCNPNPCTPHYLTALQWSQQGVSNNPPLPAIPAVPSVAMINSTIGGYPEISYFQANKYKAGSPLAGVTFSVQDALKLLDYNLTTGWPSGSSYTLLDVGHINELFAYGRSKDFASISNLLNLTGPLQAEVIFDYLNELVSITALQGNTDQSIYNNGNRGLTGELSIGNLLSQVMSQLYYGASDVLAVELTARYVYAWLVLKTPATNCIALVMACGLTPQAAAALCNNPGLMWSNPSNLDLWVLVNWNGVNSVYGMEFMSYSGLTPGQMGSLFGADSGLVSILAEADSYLKSYYGCSSPGTRCFPYELFVMQWAESAITNDLPPLLQLLGLNNETSLLSWGPPFTELFPAPPEYSSFTGSSLPLATAQSLLTPMQILNQVRCQHYFVLVFTNDVLNIPSYANITEEFGVEDVPAFTKYLRFMVDQFALQDLFITQTVTEWLWTSSSPLLTTLANTNPLQGGNPAVDPTQVQLGQNTTRASLRFPDHYKHAMYTGQTEIESKLRWWYLFFGSPNVTLYSKVYSGHSPDGPIMTYQNLQVWAEPEPIKGGDALNFQTNVTPDSAVWLYLDQFLRFGQGGFTKSLTRSNMDLHRFTISSGLLDNYIDNPDNAMYYCYGPSGAVNITPVMQGPIFISKPYFFGGEAEVLLGVLNFTTPYDSDLSTYDSYFDVEHFTGAVFEDEEKIMTMVELRTDPLYPNMGQEGYDEYGIWTYMPIFYMNRSSYYTDERVSVM